MNKIAIDVQIVFDKEKDESNEEAVQRCYRILKQEGLAVSLVKQIGSVIYREQNDEEI